MSLMSEKPASKATRTRELNDTIRYTMWSVFKLRDVLGATDRDTEASEVAATVRLAGRGGHRGARALRRQRPARRRRPDGLVARRGQRDAAVGIQHVSAGHTSVRAPEPVWSQMALHRPAEFNKSHIPAFLADEETPGAHLRLSPSSGPTSGISSTTASAARCWPSTARWRATIPTCVPTRSPRFALGDYEWMLAFEADELLPDRRPDAPPARLRDAPPRARRGAVLHRLAGLAGRADRPPALVLPGVSRR